MTARLDIALRRDELPACLQGLTTPCYLHRASRWKVTALLGLVLAVALASLVYLAWRWFHGRMPAAEVAFALFLLFFVAVLLRPSMWRAPIVMAADRQGLVFVGSREGVRVPWAETGPITIERARVMEGVGLTVIVTISAQSAFWDRARQSALQGLLLGDEKPPGFLRVPLGTQGIDPEITKASLEALRSLSGHRDPVAAVDR